MPRTGVFEAFEADQLDKMGNLLPAFAPRNLQRQADIRLDVAPGQQCGVLERDPYGVITPQNMGAIRREQAPFPMSAARDRP